MLWPSVRKPGWLRMNSHTLSRAGFHAEPTAPGATSRRTAANLREWTVSKFTEMGIRSIIKPGLRNSRQELRLNVRLDQYKAFPVRLMTYPFSGRVSRLGRVARNSRAGLGRKNAVVARDALGLVQNRRVTHRGIEAVPGEWSKVYHCRLFEYLKALLGRPQSAQMMLLIIDDERQHSPERLAA